MLGKTAPRDHAPRGARIVPVSPVTKGPATRRSRSERLDNWDDASVKTRVTPLARLTCSSGCYGRVNLELVNTPGTVGPPKIGETSAHVGMEYLYCRSPGSHTEDIAVASHRLFVSHGFPGVQYLTAVDLTRRLYIVRGLRRYKEVRRIVSR
ncbi:hypothetical protein EVAR_25134_1 [Eumeta japonica]|uniref:Uncharacterized protein n=1 Tax=Eumeta variegata TaxID=151549 RepID=A0A4C1XLG1_EUMVA|nr:hypothetical protein EVAR_25134_1 [Eumeta japonica]